MRRLDVPLICALAVTLAACGDVPQPLITSPTTASRAATGMGSAHISDTTAVVYSNLGPGLSFETWNPFTFVGSGYLGPRAISQQFFTPPGDYQFVRATLALRKASSTLRTRVFLQADSLGRPGPVIEEMGVDVTSAQGALYTVNSVSTPVLTDSLYWLTVATSSPEQIGAWFENNISDASYGFAWTIGSAPTGPWSVVDFRITLAAFQIEGRAIGSRGAVMHQASGGGSVVWESPEGEVGRVTWAVSAQSMINGNTTGQFLALAHDGALLFKGSVSCLVVVGNRAYLTVDITQAPAFLFDPMPVRFVLGLEDNGEGGKATAPDRISLLRALHEDDPVCQRVVPALEWTNGNAQVR